MVLPTYNEKDSIRQVIRDFEQLGVVDEIIVINNNAAAGTSEQVSGTSAREQTVEQGARRLKEGMWVSIFPEGTRTPPGKVGRYGIGGALLATRTGTPVLPIAHNAGEYWPRYSFRKTPGVVKVVIGPLIPTEGRDVVSVNNEVQQWIEGQMRVISPHRYADT